jgi:hypothetical protein
VAATALLAGCGGEEVTRADRDEAARAVDTYFDALSNGDGRRACALLSPDAREKVSNVDTLVEHCANPIGGALSDVPDELRADLANVKVRAARPDGGDVIVDVASSGAYTARPIKQTVRIERADDGWRIAEFPETAKTDAVTGCITGGIEAYEKGESAAFWRREGRADLIVFLQRLCKELERKWGVEESTDSQLDSVQRRVLREMIREGRIKPP